MSQRNQDCSIVIRVVAWVATVTLAAASAVPAPFRFATDDAVSYLDLADAYRLHHWRDAINGYWSPLYSWVLAAVSWIVQPSPASEILMMRATNLFVCLLSLAAFERLLGNLVTDARSPLPRWASLALGYALFLWAALVWIGVRTDTPDMCAAACVYGAAALVVSERSTRREWWRLVALGAVSAIGYLAKTALLPVGVALVAAGSIAPGRRWRTAARLACSLASFVLVAAPFVATLSHTRHRLTIGDSGKLNYVWFVYPTRRAIPDEHWQKGPAGFGAPTHSTRRVFTSPDVFEFAGPVHGTYPPWTDPSYWYAGLTARFNAAAQREAVTTNLGFYAQMFLTAIAGFYVIVFCLGGLRDSLRATIREQGRLLVPAALGLLLYLVGTNLVTVNIPTQPSTRFVAPFVVLVFAAMLAGLRLPDWPTARTAAARAAALTAVVVLVALLFTTVRTVRAAGHDEPIAWTVADNLHRAGVRCGDGVAILGRKYDRDHDHEFWARLGRVRIVSHVPDDRALLRMSPAQLDDLRAVLAATGARAVVYKPPVDAEPGSGWTLLAHGYYAYPLPPIGE